MMFIQVLRLFIKVVWLFTQAVNIAGEAFYSG